MIRRIIGPDTPLNFPHIGCRIFLVCRAAKVIDMCHDPGGIPPFMTPVQVHDETAPWTEYSYGVSDRGASVRIPWQVARDQKGYIEDRRPNANCDPYVVTRLITNTVCEALEQG